MIAASMPVPLFRRFYIDRPTRLAIHFSLVLILALGLALYFPLWVLAVGPVIYGLPHLVASFRYLTIVSGLQQIPRPLFLILAVLSGLVALMRLTVQFLPGFASFLSPQITSSHWPEVAALIVGILAIALVGRLPKRRILRGLIIGIPLIYCALTYPLVTGGFLILAHNFVGFFHWIVGARTSRDRSVAFGALLAFSLVHLLIFQSAIYQGNWSLAGISIWDLGGQIFPSSGIAPRLWSSAVIAYAFGQSVHYFVWLRAIPEQQLAHNPPSSFRQSYYWLESDLGVRGARWAVGIVLALSLVWVLPRFSEARLAYLAIASFHGYAELAGLFLVSGWRR